MVHDEGQVLREQYNHLLAVLNLLLAVREVQQEYAIAPLFQDARTSEVPFLRSSRKIDSSGSRLVLLHHPAAGG